MRPDRRTTLLFATLLAVGLLTVLASGAALAEPDLSDDNVTIEAPDPLVEDEGQTINVTVENPSDEAFVQPIVEIPLAGGLNVSDEDREPRGDGTERVVVDVIFTNASDQIDQREAFINDSTFRTGEDALQIEGEMIAPKGEVNDTKTYSFDLEVETTAEVDIEVDVFPLNDPTNNARVSKLVDPVGLGTIDASFVDGTERSITIEDDAGNELAADAEDVEIDVASGEDYTVSADISILEDDVSVEVTPAEYGISVAEFTDVEQGDAEVPSVTAQTGSTAQVIGDDLRTLDTDAGNATTNVPVEVEFELEVSSGETKLLVEDRENAPLQGIFDAGAFTAGPWHQIDATNGVGLLELTGDIDDVVTPEFEGYPLGDVTLENDVDDSDATMIADALADGTVDELVEYGDVTGDGVISAADAMKIKQYDDDNRDGDYEVINQ